MTDRLRSAFLSQATSCESLGSPFMARLMRLLADHWPEDTALAAKVAAWPGNIDPTGASLPLRIAGGLHSLILSGQDSLLAAAYPPHEVTDDALMAVITGAIRRHDPYLCDWIDRTPQTNEVGRSAVLIAAAHALAARFGLPLALSELGASAGLNLMFDRFALIAGDKRLGPDDATVVLTPDWRGDQPVSGPVQVVVRGGVDLHPVDLGAESGRLRLLSYLWPDQPERLARSRAAIDAQDAPVDRDDAVGWLARRLTSLAHPGQMHLIYHTVAWQYFPAEAQARGTALIETAGAAATADTPLAWLSMEADGTTPGAAIHLRLWPGDQRISLGRSCFHGRWIDWRHLP